MKKQAALFLAALMSVSSAANVMAAENFSDISDVPWAGAQAYINSVYENGLMVGDINRNGERVFRARDNISYNETVQLAYALSGETADDDTINKWLADMKKNNIPSWAYPCVAYALENGIITRTDIAAFMNYDGTARSATREDTAYIFGRLMTRKGFDKTVGAKVFLDKNKISAVCTKYVDILSALNVIVGDDENRFNPNTTVNRAEMAVIVSKVNLIFKDSKGEQVTDDKGEADYTGFINNVTDTALMLYTYDGRSIILDRAHDSQFYLDGKEINTRGIYSLTTNGILVKADIYVNSNNVAMEIYCTRNDVEGQITGIGTKKGTYKKGSKKYEYDVDTITLTYANGLSRSYIIDDDSEFYYDDEEIDLDELQDLVGKYIGEKPEDAEDRKFLPVYGTADVEFNDEYYVYPQARIKTLRMHRIELETAIISSVTNESIVVLDKDGREYEYYIDDGARFYVNGDKVRITQFKSDVKLKLTEVSLRFKDDGYVTRVSAETK